MAQSIEDIIFTDKKAREIVEKAQERRELILGAAEKERDRIVKEGKEKLENLKNSLQAENEAFEASVREENQSALNEKKDILLSRYEEHEAEWSADIFSRITANN